MMVDVNLHQAFVQDLLAMRGDPLEEVCYFRHIPVSFAVYAILHEALFSFDV